MSWWRVMMAGCLMLACLLAGCATPGELGVTVHYDMNPTPPAVSVTVNQSTWLPFGRTSMSVSTTGAATVSVTVNL